MEKMLVVVVEDESKAYQASKTLNQLDAEGNISIYGEAVVAKNADGKMDVKELVGDFPIRLVAGTTMGALIGLLGGPLGLVIGADVGTLAGGIGELHTAGVGADFIDDVAGKLTPGKFAVIADIDEEWVTPVDTQMEALGATVVRTPKQSFEAEQRAKELAKLRGEIEQMKNELDQAHTNRKAKIQGQLDRLDARLKAQVDQAKHRLEQMKSETDAKVHALGAKREKARADRKARLDAQMKRIRQEYEESDTKLRHAIAEQLRSAAARVDKQQPEPVHH